MAWTISVEISSGRDEVYGVITDHAELSRVAPRIVRSVRTLSVRPDTYLAEERLVLGGREYLSMVRHRLEPPSAHTYTIVGGDAKGSTITEILDETAGGTRVTAHIEWRMGLRRMGGGRIRDSYQELLDAIRDELEP